VGVERFDSGIGQALTDFARVVSGLRQLKWNLAIQKAKLKTNQVLADREFQFKKQQARNQLMLANQQLQNSIEARKEQIRQFNAQMKEQIREFDAGRGGRPSPGSLPVEDFTGILRFTFGDKIADEAVKDLKGNFISPTVANTVVRSIQSKEVARLRDVAAARRQYAKLFKDLSERAVSGQLEKMNPQDVLKTLDNMITSLGTVGGKTLGLFNNEAKRNANRMIANLNDLKLKISEDPASGKADFVRYVTGAEPGGFMNTAKELVKILKLEEDATREVVTKSGAPVPPDVQQENRRSLLDQAAGEEPISLSGDVGQSSSFVPQEALSASSESDRKGGIFGFLTGAGKSLLDFYEPSSTEPVNIPLQPGPPAPVLPSSSAPLDTLKRNASLEDFRRALEIAGQNSQR